MVRFLNEFWSRDDHGEILINWQLSYNVIMQILHKLLLNLALGVSLLVLLYALFTDGDNRQLPTDITRSESASAGVIVNSNYTRNITQTLRNDEEYIINSIHIWCILTKVDTNQRLKTKFKIFFDSIIKQSTKFISLHVISDNAGQLFATKTSQSYQHVESIIKLHFYDMTDYNDILEPVVNAMRSHFSSSTSSYYSDTLFFLSINLHKIAPHWMSHCMMVDIDTQFKSDPSLLWDHFNKFSSTQLIGLAPELSPVYRHALFSYRVKNPNTKTGEPYSEGGNPGLNSGVVLFNLTRLRKSKIYSDLCDINVVKILVKKYHFRGHLGDQDFYTLLGIERPELIYILPCNWNRQLCMWWNQRGYIEVFPRYFKCDGQVHLYHGNCNTQIPSS